MKTTVSAQEIYRQGECIHDACYPFGLRGNYLDAARCFREAWEQAEIDGLSDLFIYQCRFSYYDALADHEYYNTEDYKQAANYYGLAIDMVKCILKLIKESDKTIWRANLQYLQAVREESLGLHLESQGDWAGAIEQLRRAIRIYKAYRRELPHTSETEHEHQLLLHSIIGLLGQVCYERGMLYSERQNWLMARWCFERALVFYDRALTYHPSWGLSTLADNYHRWVDMVRQSLASLPSDKAG